MALVLKFVTLNFIVPTVKLGHRVLGEFLTLKVFGLCSDGVLGWFIAAKIYLVFFMDNV